MSLDAALRPPKGLSATSRSLWSAIAAGHALRPHHAAILEAALTARDRAQTADAEIAAQGLLVSGRYGPRQNPAVPVSRDGWATFARLMASLGLDADDPRPRGGRR